MALDVYAWKGSASFYPGDTPNGFYDTDPEFQSDILRSCNWAAKSLGYPNYDIELSDEQFFAAFEDAVTEYSAQVNFMNIKNNMFTMQGSKTGSDLTGKYVRDGILNTYQIADDYGSSVGIGGDITPLLTQIKTTSSIQRYSLSDHGISSSGIIRNVFHYEIPASLRFMSPFAGGGFYGMLNQLGLGEAGYSAASLLIPNNLSVMRMQAIELTDMIRRADYTFEIIGDQLKVFPIPSSTNTLWIEWFERNDSDKFTETPHISDFSNMPYGNIPYCSINQPGKQWIRKYFLALCKEMLGLVRSKYQNISLPDGDVGLDGELLRSEGKDEKEAFITQLREDLEELKKSEVYRREADAAQAFNDMTQFKPLLNSMWWG